MTRNIGMALAAAALVAAAGCSDYLRVRGVRDQPDRADDRDGDAAHRRDAGEAVAARQRRPRPRDVDVHAADGRCRESVPGHRQVFARRQRRRRFHDAVHRRRSRRPEEGRSRRASERRQDDARHLARHEGVAAQRLGGHLGRRAVHAGRAARHVSRRRRTIRRRRSTTVCRTCSATPSRRSAPVRAPDRRPRSSCTRATARSGRRSRTR